ncbi:MAG: SAM-dependent methyltransferase [Longimicrobiales bacterium]
MIRPDARIDPEHVARHYDSLDPFYRELWGEHLHHGLWLTGRESADEAVRLLVREVARLANITNGNRVCDVGCGYGATARMIADEAGAYITGFTLSRVQHDRAVRAAAGNPRLRFVLHDWLTNTLDDGHFDAVIAIESTEHMEDKPRFFAESARVLRPGGRLVVCAWLAADSPEPWQRRFLLEPICAEGRLPSIGTITEYRNWIHDAGLSLESFADLTPRVVRTWTLCTTRVARRIVTRPSSWAFLLDRANSDRGFALTVLRILLAYRTGCMRYGIFAAQR